MKQYDQWTRRKALEAWSSGWTYEEIAETYGPSRRTLQLWAKEEGLEPRPPTRHDDPTVSERKDAVRLYLRGMPSRDVGEVYGVNKSTVCKWARRATGSRRANR